MAQDTDCLVSTIKNTSGGTLRLSCLPPHGRTLTSNEEYTVDGDIIAAIRAKFGGDYAASKRAVDAFTALLRDGSLELIKTPAPILYDPTLDKTQQLKLDNGVLYSADPCWLATSSSYAV